MTWDDMTVEQRAIAVHAGMLEGLGGTGIAQRLGTTRDAIRGIAWRAGITPANLDTWTYGPKRKADKRKRWRRRKRGQSAKPPQNRTANVAETIEPVVDVAVELGVSTKTLRIWHDDNVE